MSTVLVLGWYGHGNCGDESYKITFPLLFPDRNFTFVDTIKETDLSDIELIVLGGGDVVKKTFMADLYDLNKPMIAASVTITPGSDLENLNKFQKIIVRDKRSLGIASKYHKNVEYLPDFSFILTPNKDRGRKIIEDRFNTIGHKLTDKVVTVVLNSYIFFNTKSALARDVFTFNKFADDISSLCEKMDSSWVFLPFSVKAPWDDRAISSLINDRCKEKYYKNAIFYDDNMSVQDTLDIIAGSNAMISSRLHSTIFSTISGIPFIDILHHDKNLGYIETLGLMDWTTWVWQYESTKVERLLKEFLIIGNQGEELKSFTKLAKEQLKNAAPFILR